MQYMKQKIEDLILKWKMLCIFHKWEKVQTLRFNSELYLCSKCYKKK